MTTEIKLPPLPELGEYATIWERIIEWYDEPEVGTKALALSDKVDDEITATLQAYATAAVEQDRAQRGEPIAMKPVLYRYRDSESVIKHMDGYTPGEGWEPLYSQDQVDQLQAQLVRQQKSYEAEIKVEIDSALERAAEVCVDISPELRRAAKRHRLE